MATQTVSTTSISFNWILSPRKDIIFYICSALAGWIYVGIIIYAILNLKNPLSDPLFTLNIGPLYVPFYLNLLVVVCWGIFLDAPHLFATLARTMFDPDEWATRRNILLKSWLLFLLGPLLILSPYIVSFISSLLFNETLSSFDLILGAILFTVFFKLWAYYHVVRQHWGFVSLYKRKANDYSNLINTIDKWFFRLSLYVPLLMFMTAVWYPNNNTFPDLHLRDNIAYGLSIGGILYPILWLIYLGALLFYISFQFYLYTKKVPLNGSKLFYLSLIVPLHFVAFSNPIIVLFVTPIVTIGHNIQYHMIVWSYSQNKYPKLTGKNYTFAKSIFSNVLIYAFLGLMFTLLLYRGPWIDLIQSFTGIALNNLFLNSFGMMAGVTNPAQLDLGTQLFAAFLLGWAMQHYYLDSKIWRISKDKNLQKNLNV